MLDPEREAEMDLEGDSNEVSGSPTTRSASQFMDYEMFSSLSPLDPSFYYSVSVWNSPSPGRRPQSPEFNISLWEFPSPSRGPSPEPGFSRLISSHGNASSSTQPPVRSPSPTFGEQDVRVFLEFLRLQLDVTVFLLRLQLQEELLQLQLQEERSGLLERLQLQEELLQLQLLQLQLQQRSGLLERLQLQEELLQLQLLQRSGLLERLQLQERSGLLERHQLQEELSGLQEELLLQEEQLLQERLQLQEELLQLQLQVQLQEERSGLQEELLQRLEQLQQREERSRLLEEVLLTAYLDLCQELARLCSGLCQEVDKQGAFFMVQQLARLCSLSNEKRELHKFIQNVSQVTLQIKIKMAHEICKEGHDNTSIEILDKMTVVTDVFALHFSWTKAPCRHRSQNNASDLKKSCTSFDGCYKHQDCMSTIKLEICIDAYVDDMEILQKLFSSHMLFFCSEYTLLCYGGKIESQGFHAICEPIAPADDEPDSRCELTHISHCTRSPPGPNGLPDGEEMPQQDSPKHQLMRETHAMNDGENVLSEDAIHSAVSYPENEGTRKTLKRKHGKNKIQIPPEDLLTFSGTLMDAVKYFKVSKSTIKRHCRQHGITNWQYRTIDNNSQSLSKPKDIIESIQGEGAEMGNQMARGSRPCERELNHGQLGSDRSQIGVGLMEESSTQLETTPMGNMFASSTHEQCIEAGDHSELPLQPSKSNLSAARRLDAVNSILPQIPEREFLIENSGSSRELSDHYISATEAFNAKQVPDSSRTNLSCSDPAPKLDEATASDMMPLLDRRTMTIKATYRKVKIRFQLSLTSGIIDLRKEVAKRLPLEVGTFGIEYLDDDNEWILMTCDADLQECFNISKSLNCNVIKLLIQDIMPISGAPYEAMDN